MIEFFIERFFGQIASTISGQIAQNYDERHLL